MKVLVFCYASSQINFFYNLDPSLNSDNYGSKNYSSNNYHIFRKTWTSAFRWYILDTSEKCSNLRKKRLRLHSFGPFWTISTENQWEISEFGCLSCFIDFFVWFHIVCDRCTSDYDHFTFSNTTLGLDPAALILTVRRTDWCVGKSKWS